jgi:hypothetical protein
MKPANDYQVRIIRRRCTVLAVVYWRAPLAVRSRWKAVRISEHHFRLTAVATANEAIARRIQMGILLDNLAQKGTK